MSGKRVLTSGVLLRVWERWLCSNMRAFVHLVVPSQPRTTAWEQKWHVGARGCVKTRAFTGGGLFACALGDMHVRTVQLVMAHLRCSRTATNWRVRARCTSCRRSNSQKPTPVPVCVAPRGGVDTKHVRDTLHLRVCRLCALGVRECGPVWMPRRNAVRDLALEERVHDPTVCHITRAGGPPASPP